jgi:phytoene desaturase
MVMSTEHAVVVGAGMGGMAAAIRLRARGYRVTLLEANEQLGGRAATFHSEGFRFDGGPTVVTAPYLFDELFQLVGRDPKDYYEMQPVDPFYRVKFDDGEMFDYVGDEQRILSQIERLSPRDVDGYRRLAAHSQEIFDIGYTQLADVPFDTIGEMMRAAPHMIRLRNYRSVYGAVASYIKDPRLRQVFTFQPLLIGGNPFHCPSIYLLIHWLERKWGVWFPKGGMGALVQAMGRLMEEIGIDIRLNSPIEHIDVVNGKAKSVRLAGGQTVNADLVVSNADPSTVYTKFIDPQHRKKHTDRNVKRKKQSMSLFVAYFGAEGSWKDTAHHTILLGPRYKELLHDIFRKKVLSDDFSLYLHRPAWTDTSLDPQGGEGFYVLSPVPNQKSGIDWGEVGPAYMDKIMTYLDEGELPGIKANLKTSFYIDPRHFEGKLQSMDGAAFGVEPVLQQSAYFRYHNRSPDVEGLFFCGANTHPGAGLPGVLCSAKVLDRVLPTPAQKEPIPEARPQIRISA